jgi:hypothetical protein
VDSKQTTHTDAVETKATDCKDTAAPPDALEVAGSSETDDAEMNLQSEDESSAELGKHSTTHLNTEKEHVDRIAHDDPQLAQEFVSVASKCTNDDWQEMADFWREMEGTSVARPRLPTPAVGMAEKSVDSEQESCDALVLLEHESLSAAREALKLRSPTITAEPNSFLREEATRSNESVNTLHCLPLLASSKNIVVQKSPNDSASTIPPHDSASATTANDSGLIMQTESDRVIQLEREKAALQRKLDELQGKMAGQSACKADKLSHESPPADIKVPLLQRMPPDTSPLPPIPPACTDMDKTPQQSDFEPLSRLEVTPARSTPTLKEPLMLNSLQKGKRRPPPSLDDVRVPWNSKMAVSPSAPRLLLTRPHMSAGASPVEQGSPGRLGTDNEHHRPRATSAEPRAYMRPSSGIIGTKSMSTMSIVGKARMELRPSSAGLLGLGRRRGPPIPTKQVALVSSETLEEDARLPMDLLE